LTDFLRVDSGFFQKAFAVKPPAMAENRRPSREKPSAAWEKWTVKAY
jgi:hypothetical protein